MNNLLKSNLDRINTQGLELSFDQILDQGFKSWKKITLPAAGIYLILGLITSVIVVASMPLIYGVAISDFMDVAQSDPEYFQNYAKSPQGIIGTQALSLLIMLLFTPISTGIMKMAYNAMLDKPVVFSDAFAYFKAPYYFKLIGYTILFSFLPALLFAALGMIWAPFVYFGYLVSIFVTIFFLFVPGLIVFGDASIMDAAKISFNVASKKLGLIIALIIIIFLFQLLGAMACCIGILFTLSFNSAIQMSMYREIFMQGDTDNGLESTLE